MTSDQRLRELADRARQRDGRPSMDADALAAHARRARRRGQGMALQRLRDLAARARRRR